MLTLLLFYCGAILLASLLGGWIPIMIRLTHTRLQVATSGVAGLMLGVGILRLLPHACESLDSIDVAMGWFLGGFLVMFFLQRFFHFHHHDVPDEDPEGCDGQPAACSHEPDGDGEEGGLHHDHTLAGKSARHLSWSGAALGLTLHSLIDGVALAASLEGDRAGSGQTLLGFGTFLVIVLHKPFDALVISTLMTREGWSRRSRHLVNGLFALAIPAGTLLFYLGAGGMDAPSQPWMGAALAFAAGTFICIAASDLLPELQFHSHDRIKLSIALAAGLALAAAIGWFESHDEEEHAPPPANTAARLRV